MLADRRTGNVGKWSRALIASGAEDWAQREVGESTVCQWSGGCGTKGSRGEHWLPAKWMTGNMGGGGSANYQEGGGA